MSIRTFVFCDICNTQGIRVPEERRKTQRSSTQGRRIHDGRAWVEGNADAAKEAGWHIDPNNRHVCPRCFSRGLHEQ